MEQKGRGRTVTRRRERRWNLPTLYHLMCQLDTYSYECLKCHCSELKCAVSGKCTLDSKDLIWANECKICHNNFYIDFLLTRWYFELGQWLLLILISAISFHFFISGYLAFRITYVACVVFMLSRTTVQLYLINR